MKSLTELIDNEDFVANLTYSGLSAYAVAYLMEVTGIPDFLSSSYNPNSGACLGDYLGEISESLESGVMDSFWSVIKEYAPLDRFAYSIKFYRAIIGGNLDSAPAHLVDVFPYLIENSEIPEEEVEYQLMEIQMFSKTPSKYFKGMIRSRLEEIDSDTIPNRLEKEYELAKKYFMI